VFLVTFPKFFLRFQIVDLFGKVHYFLKTFISLVLHSFSTYERL